MSTLTAVAVRVTEFWMNVATSDNPAHCWEWTGYQEDGYGRFSWEGRMVGAHELAVTFTTGEARTSGLDTCHSCNNPICCNPEHLRFDTRAGNVADMLSARRDRPGRFSDEQIIAMRERYAHGASQKALAADYGVTNGLISQIVRGIRYARVGGPLTTKRGRYNHGE